MHHLEPSSPLDRPVRTLRTAVLTASLLILWGTSGALFASNDFRSFRGESGRGTATKAPFASALKSSWTRPIGSAYSGISIADGLLITAEARDGRDLIVALDANTGATKWSLDLAEAYIGHGGSLDGLIATPAIDADRVFAVGNRGQVVSIDLASGREIWRQDLSAADPENETEAPYYGFASSPLVLDGLVVVQVGSPGGAAVALDRATGAIAWRTEGDLIEAQSPIAMTVDGKQQILVASNTSLKGLDPEEGTVQWSYPVDANSAFSLTRSPLPLPDGTIFFTPHDDRSVVIRPPSLSSPAGAEPPQPELIWEANALTRTYSPAALIGDTLVGYTSRFLAAYSSKDGSRLWRSRTPGDGFLIGLGDTQAAIVTKDGSLHLGTVQDGWSEQWSEEVFDELVWTPPSYANRSIYVRSMTQIARFDLQTDQVTSLDTGPVLPTTLANLTDRSESGIRRFLDGKQMPLVEGDRALFLWRGEAQDVGIAGDLLGMRREESFRKLEDTDLWWYEAQLDPALDYSYVLFVDYEPTLDPLNPRREFNTVMGWNANWVSPGTPPAEMSAFAMPQHPGPPKHLRPDASEPVSIGQLTELTITGDDDLIRAAAAEIGIEGEQLEGASELFGRVFSKPVPVWLPPGYEESDDRYPVVYVLKGPGALDETRGRWPDTLNRLAGQDFAPLIAVFLDGPMPRPVPTSAIVAAVDKQLRTRTDRDSRALISMGMVSFEAIARSGDDPDLFGKLGVQEFFGFDEEIEISINSIEVTEDHPWSIYLDWGSMGIHSPTEGWDMRAGAQQVYDALQAKGAKMSGGEVPATLEWKSWRNRTHHMLSALFPLE